MMDYIYDHWATDSNHTRAVVDRMLFFASYRRMDNSAMLGIVQQEFSKTVLGICVLFPEVRWPAKLLYSQAALQTFILNDKRNGIIIAPHIETGNHQRFIIWERYNCSHPTGQSKHFGALAYLNMPSSLSFAVYLLVKTSASQDASTLRMEVGVSIPRPPHASLG